MIPRFIDVHTHINFKAFKDDGQDTIQRALDKDIGMILVGSQNSTSRRSVEYACKYSDKPVFAAVGLHPIHLEDRDIDVEELGGEGSSFRTRAEEFDYDYYKELARDNKVVAIGEVGLDYYRTTDSRLRMKQKEVFRRQIELALETKKALMIHCRQAHDDCIAILKEYFPYTENLKLTFERSESAAKADSKNSLHGDIHFFEGTLEQAEEYFKLGFTVSFTGVITFVNAQRHRELVAQIPLEYILLETDAPYITPEPYRGKRNEPAFVDLVAQKVADIKGISFDEVAKITTKTANAVFSLGLFQERRAPRA